MPGKEGGQTERAGEGTRTSFFSPDDSPTDPPQESNVLSNGLRYPRVGGTRQSQFDGTSFGPHKLLENAATPTRRVHAVLGGISFDVLPTDVYKFLIILFIDILNWDNNR